MIRPTVALSYRSGSEVLVHDTGLLPALAVAYHALGEIEAALADNSGAILEGGAQLVVRVAERSSLPMAEDPAARRPKRCTPRPGEF